MLSSLTEGAPAADGAGAWRYRTTPELGGNARWGMTPNLTLNATVSGNGATSVVFGATPTGGATWWSLGTDSSAPWSVAYDTTKLADGAHTLSASLAEYRDAHLPPDSPKHAETYTCGDMNTSLIQTALGRTVVLQHDVVGIRFHQMRGDRLELAGDLPRRQF